MLLKPKDREVLQKLFADKLHAPVRLRVFSDGTSGKILSAACPECSQMVQLMNEVAELSEHITVDIVNFNTDKETVEKYGIKRIPALVIEGEKDYGVRYYGLPAGYEFSSFVEDVIDVARGETDLSAESLEQLARIDTPVHIQVFVTPTCPYCPSAVRLAHKMAIVNDNITADMIEAQTFPELAVEYDVFGVPRTVINEDFHFEGAVPEYVAVAHVLNAVGKLTEEEAALAGIVAE